MLVGAVLMTFMTLIVGRTARGGLRLPSAALCGSWALVFSLQALLAPDMYSSSWATAVIIFLSAAFVLGDVIGEGWAPPAPQGDRKTVMWPEKRGRSERRLRAMVILFGGLSLWGAFNYANALGTFSASGITEMFLNTGSVRERIFTGEIVVGLPDRIGFLVSYSGVVLSMSYWFFYGSRWWLWLSPLGVLLLGVAQAGRAGTMIIMLQGIALVILKKVVDRRYHLGKWLFLLPGALIVVFVSGHLLRQGFSDTSSAATMRALTSARSYLFGGVSAFAYYCDHRMPASQATLGMYSFSSLFAALGIAPQAPGVYDEFVPISPQGEMSNIFSAYRSFIDDFLLPGAAALIALAGGVAGLAYRRFTSGRLYWVAFLVPALSWMMFAPFYSLTYFNSFLLSLLMPVAICRWAIEGGAPRQRPKSGAGERGPQSDARGEETG